MATRMQQRRGTAAQWTAANPILAAGEIGFETDTSKFKMGNGTSTWSALTYFANAAELTNIIDGAPDLLNTLNELAASIGDDPAFLTTMNGLLDSISTDLSDHGGSGIDVHGISNTGNLAYKSEITDHVNDTTTVHGIADTAALATKTYADNAVLGHQSDTTDVHGIADTSVLETTSGSQAKADAAEADAITAAGSAADTKVSDHNANTTNVHGIANTALLETLSGAQSKADAAEAAAITAAASAADTKVSDHNSDTTNVHGISDTAALATKTYADGAVSTAVSALTKSSVGLANVDNTTDANKPVSTATQTALDLKAPLADPTFTGTVSGVTKAMVGLTNVNDTADADKPVSTATQTALDAKASLAGAVFTGNVEVDGNLVVDGDFTVNGTNFNASATSIVIEDNMLQLAHNQAGNSVDLGLVVAYNDGTYRHAGIVRDVSESKWKLFKNVATDPTTTVDFASGALDDLQLAALQATTVTASSGIVFSDGTQTKLGVLSVTTFATAISSSATLAAGEADKFVPLTGAVTITLPASGYSTGQSIDFYQASGTGAQFSNANSTVGTPGLKFRTTNSVVTAMKTAAGWLVFGDLSL
jgi:hypothetical protein